MVIFDEIWFDFSWKLSDDLKRQLSIVFNFIPKCTFNKVLLEVGFGEELDNIGWLHFFDFLWDGGQTRLTSVTVVVSKTVDRTLKQKQQFGEVLL